ncbi:hypothetical protein BTVI_98894 [Pitangus sulphuratus]|nr:hypothetical protein BTVI_98894 [Pitangus sulphuratus]
MAGGIEPPLVSSHSPRCETPPLTFIASANFFCFLSHQKASSHKQEEEELADASVAPQILPLEGRVYKSAQKLPSVAAQTCSAIQKWQEERQLS